MYSFSRNIFRRFPVYFCYDISYHKIESKLWKIRVTQNTPPKMDSDNEAVIISSSDEYSTTSDDDVDFGHGLRYENRTLNMIDYQNREFLDSEKESGKYYVGLCVIYNNYILLDVAICPRVMLAFEMSSIKTYLILNSTIVQHNTLPWENEINIMKLYTDETGTYSVVIKTHWLRLVQRTWKRVFRERNEILKKRRNIGNLRVREITGKHRYGLNVLPSIHGMLFVKGQQI